MLRVFAWGMTLALAAGSGCAGQSSALRDENAALRLELSEVQAERRRDRRLIRDLEKQIALLEGGDGSGRIGARGAAAFDPHRLPVEVREPAPDDSDGDVLPSAHDTLAGEVAYRDDEVEIVYVGDAAKDEAVRPSIKLYETSRSEPSPAAEPAAPIDVDERLPVADVVPPIPKGAAAESAAAKERPAADDPRALYKRYYEALRAGNHNFAIVGFRSFTERFPRHDYADNAQYWLGEAYYDQKDFRAALTEFRAVIDNHPRGNKVPDAMLKAAFCYHQLGYLQKARDALVALIDGHPKSNAAALAKQRLDELEPAPSN